MSDEEWEIVANPVRAKREARKERRSQKDEEGDAMRRREYELKAEEVAREMFDARKTSVQSSASSELPNARTQTISSRRAAKNARKGKSKSSNKSTKLPKDETDLVEFLQKILVLESKSLTTAELGARMQASTGTSWNKAFKPTFGAMDKFLKSHSEEFHLAKESGETSVSLQSRKKSGKKKAKRSSPDVSPSSSPRAPRVSKPSKSSSKSPPAAKNGVEKKSSKPTPPGEEHVSKSNSKSPSSKPSKKSKRKRNSAKSNESSSVCGSFVTLLLVVFTLLVAGLAFFRLQDEALFISYQDKAVKLVERALSDFS